LAHLAIHDHVQRLRELQVTDASLLFDCGLIREPLPIDGAFAGVGIHREISDLKCSEILKEVASLRGRDAEVAEAILDDGTGPRDFVPFDRNAEPWVIRSPASDADEEVGTIFLSERGIEMGHGAGNFLAATALESLRVDDNDVVQILDPAVAEDF